MFDLVCAARVVGAPATEYGIAARRVQL